MSIQLSRRKFIMGATAALVAAPAIIRASSLMRVKPVFFYGVDLAGPDTDLVSIWQYDQLTEAWALLQQRGKWPAELYTILDGTKINFHVPSKSALVPYPRSSQIFQKEPA